MLQPKRMKFRKMMKGRNRGLAHRGSKISFGEYGLKATGRGRITARQIEAGRRAICPSQAGGTPAGHVRYLDRARPSRWNQGQGS